MTISEIGGKPLRTRIKEILESDCSNEESLRHAFMHIGKSNTTKMLDGQPDAIGTFYELLVYEKVLQYSAIDQDVRFVVAKGVDASKRTLGHSSLPPKDGLYYDRDLRIAIKGDGRSLGEYDFIIFDKLGDIVFFEVKKSRRYFKDLKYKLQYKMRILEELFGCSVNLLLVCAEEMGNSKNVMEILEATDGEYAFLRMPTQGNITNLHNSVNYTGGISRDGQISSKLCNWDQLETLRKLDYAENHKQLRKFLISLVEIREPLEIIKKRIRSSLIERVFIGKIAQDSIESFMKTIVFNLNGKSLDFNLFNNDFSEVILALSVPRLVPIIYLKERKKNRYQKTMPDDNGIFEDKGKVVPGSGFYKPIVDTEEIVDSNLASMILDTFL